MRRSERAPAGRFGFTVIALGQFVSMLGTGMTRFAITIYAWQVTGALSGAFESFQFPAYSAAVTTMLPKEQYARANGMISLVESASGVLSPILAGGLIGVLGIGGILTIDVITF